MELSDYACIFDFHHELNTTVYNNSNYSIAVFELFLLYIPISILEQHEVFNLQYTDNALIKSAK